MHTRDGHAFKVEKHTPLNNKYIISIKQQRTSIDGPQWEIISILEHYNTDENIDNKKSNYWTH